jgi:hypothetical protein
MTFDDNTTGERDPALRALFAETAPDLPADDFVEAVMARVVLRRRRALAGWVAAAFALVVGVALLAGPLFGATALLTDGLATAVIPLDDSLLADLAAPLNSVAGILAFAVLLLRRVLRRA